jgi:glycosyltransferase involved in cell wall biosynthesis
MRVLTVGNMYPPHHLGGYELMWRSWVNQMRAAGDEVRVLTTDHREAEPDPSIPADPDVHRALRWYWRDHDFPRYSVRERLRIERHNLSVLDHHLEEFGPGAIAWWAMGGMSLSLLERARAARVPAVAVIVDEWLAYAPRVDAWQRAFARGPVAALAQRLTGIPTGIAIERAAEPLFVSAYLRDRAVAIGFDVGGAEVVHAGIETGRFESRPARAWAGRLLCLGRIDERKGVATAIRALAELPECSLRCVGDGDREHLAELERLAGELGVADRVAFDRVARHEVPGALADADALLFCVTWPEPFGLVPLEAMAVGIPVVATGTGGSGEYLADGENCLAVPPGDPTAAAAAVRRLAGSPELVSRLREGGLSTSAGLTDARFNDAVRAALGRAAGAGEAG